MKDVADISLETCQKVQDICADFFAISGLNYFNFVRVFDDGSRICLSNNYAWMQFVFANHLDYKIIFEERIKYPVTTYLIWDMVPTIREDALIQTANKDFDICHGVTLILKHQGYIDFAYYATSPDNDEINMFYINNLHVLNIFLLFFIERAQPIIINAEKHRFKIAGHQLGWKSEDSNIISPIQAYIESISEKISPTEALAISRYYLSGDSKNTYLSKREAECLADLFDGFAVKEIARKRNMSPRTVEVHIEHVKLKLNCSTKSEMINKAKDSGFEQIYKAIRAEDF